MRVINSRESSKSGLIIVFNLSKLFHPDLTLSSIQYRSSAITANSAITSLKLSEFYAYPIKDNSIVVS